MTFSPSLKALTAALSLSAFTAYGATSNGYFIYKDFDTSTAPDAGETPLVWDDFKFNNKGFQGGINSDTGLPNGPAHPDVDTAQLRTLLLTYGYSSSENTYNSPEDQASNDAFGYDDQNVTWQARSVFKKDKVSLVGTTFRTKFKFHLDAPNQFNGGFGEDQLNGNSGADGFVFVIQTETNLAGSAGGGIGYTNIENSVGIEFDTFGNFVNGGAGEEAYLDCLGPEGSRSWDGTETPPAPVLGNSCGETTDEISDNHIGININGNPASVVMKHINETFNSQRTETENDPLDRNWWAWVDYNGTELTVEVLPVDINDNAIPARPNDPSRSLSYEIDLLSIIGSNDAYIGFTAGTGSKANKHEILYWEFGNTFEDTMDVTPPEYSLESTGTFACNSNETLELEDGQTLFIQDNLYAESSEDTNGNGIFDTISGLKTISLSDGGSNPNMTLSYNSFAEGTQDTIQATVELTRPSEEDTRVLTLTDVSGNRCNVNIHIGEDPAPQAIAYVYPEGATNTTVSITIAPNASLTLDGSNSTDNDSDLSYYWDFDNSDGDTDKDSEQDVVTHQYSTPGTYTATLHVIDSKDQESTATVSIIVNNDAPTADAKVSSVTFPSPATSIDAKVGESITLDGSNSSDAEDPLSALTFLWTSNNSATITDNSAHTTEIEFDSVGSHSVTLTVTDTTGEASSATVTINVINQAPSAQALVKLTTSSDAPTNQLSITVDQQIDLIAANAQDLEDDLTATPLQYHWAVTDEQGNAVTTLNGETAQYSFNTGGTYTLALTITDSHGATYTDNATVVVRDLINPTAFIKLTNSAGETISFDDNLQAYFVNQGESITLDGSQSTDSDGDIETYQWSGITNSSQSVTVNGTFDGYEDKTVTLTVTDNDGLTGTVSVLIKINKAPYIYIKKLDIEYGDKEGQIAEADRTFFTVGSNTILIEEGRAVTLDASNSYDDTAIASYKWCKGYNPEIKTCTEVLSTSVKFDFSTTTKVDELITLIVTDEHDTSSAATFTVKKYVANYEASGSMGVYLLSILGGLLLLRRQREKGVKQ